MFDPGPEATLTPYIAFRFQVELSLKQSVPGISGLICRGAFAECDGLEMSMEPKTVREGGNNQEQIHLIGPISYSQLTLKRGMTSNRDLWNWFAAAGQTGRKSTAEGKVIVADASGKPSITFYLRDCLPVKLRGPALNAKDGQVAIEEMQLVYSSLSLRPTDGPVTGLSMAGGFSAGASVDLSAGISAGVSASANVSGGIGMSGGVSASASADATTGLNLS